jgi:hypothetical protein
MKRTLLAVSFAVLAAPVYALEVSAPFEQTQFDRGLQNVEQSASTGASSTKESIWADDYNFIAPAQ